jgi:hypothetical protein
MMGKMMDKSSCRWVRDRLPLWTGTDEGPSGTGGDGDDLGAADRRSIEAHLVTCPACREYRSGLGRALEALDVAAVSPPAVPDGSSLWPALERRIAAHRSRRGSRASGAAGPVAGRAGLWTLLDEGRPLRSAWMRDTVSELVAAAGLGAAAGRPGPAGRRRAGASWRIAGASLAASIWALLVVVPVSWRLHAAAEARIRDNAAPVAMVDAIPDPPGDEPPMPIDHAPPRVRDIPDSQLVAQAEPVKPPADPPPSNDATSAAKSGAPARYNYDLQIGTPMPLDGRDDKPVY